MVYYSILALFRFNLCVLKVLFQCLEIQGDSSLRALLVGYFNVEIKVRDFVSISSFNFNIQFHRYFDVEIQVFASSLVPLPSLIYV